MASKRIDINISGKANAGNALKTTSEQINQLAKNAKKPIELNVDTKRAISNMQAAEKQAAKSSSNMKKSFDSVGSGLDQIGMGLASVLGGFGAVEIGNMMWTGATQREFSKAYLAMQLGTDQAAAFAKEIERIVQLVPGDDTAMNNLLGSAATRGAAIKDLEKLGRTASDYFIAAQKTGMTQIEASQDLNSYILTGTTGELQRSRVLAGQVDTLENKKTVSERILALEAALVKNQWAGVSALDVTLLKWEVFKGKIQKAATDIGTNFIGALSGIFDYLTVLDDATAGWSSQLMIAGGAALALTPIALMLLPSMVQGFTMVTGAVKAFSTQAAIAGVVTHAAFWPAIAIVGGLTAALYVLTAGARANAETMRVYNDEIKNGDAHVQALRDTSARYSGELEGLKKKKQELIAAGKSTVGVEADIAFAEKNSASAAAAAAQAEIDLKAAREAKSTIDTQVTTQEQDYATQIRNSMVSSGKFTKEQIANFDAQSKALKEGTSLKQYGADQEKRIYDQSLGFTNDIVNGKNKESEAWLKDADALQSYTTGMDSLAKLERDYMNADSWLDKGKIYILQGITKAQVDWTNAMIVAGSYWGGFVQQVYGGAASIRGAWGNTVAWFMNGWNQIKSGAGWVYNAIVGSLSAAAGWVSKKASEIRNYITSKWEAARNFISARNIIGSVGSTAKQMYDGVVAWWNNAKAYVEGIPIVGQVVKAITGPRGPARGPAGPSGLNYNYQGYGGHQKDNVWSASGTTLTGNCVDMTLGLMGRYGGSMVAGTWNGGPHVWWQDNMGNQFDPARMAIDGIGTPPARGPGDGGNIVIYGDVYGFDDFAKKVEQASASIYFDAGRC